MSIDIYRYVWSIVIIVQLVVSAKRVAIVREDHGYLALCVIARDQAAATREFVQYHRSIGVNRIYVYDHGSDDPMYPSLLDFIKTGLVEYTYFTGHHNPLHKGVKVFSTTAQGYAYEDCIGRAQRRHKWLGFIDVDEFLVLKDPLFSEQNINAFLKPYEEYGALAVNWVIFGSSGHEFKVNNTLVEYTKCLPASSTVHRHIKTLANTKYLKSIGPTPHGFQFTEKKFAVNEDLQPVHGPLSQTVASKRIALHHYVVKSREDFTEKAARGGGSGSVKTMSFFNKIDAMATETCLSAVEKGKQCCG